MKSLFSALSRYGETILNADKEIIEINLLKLDKSILNVLDKPFTGELNVTDLTKTLNQILKDFDIDIEREIDYIFGLITPSQKQINTHFWSLYKTNPNQATNYLYTLGKHNHYIQVEKVKLNQQYLNQDLIVTINLSKEEKDNKKILELSKKTTTTFPKCALCFENVGYKGIGEQPPRSTLRVAEMTLDHDPWFMQYSPYPYFEEHAIFIDKTHRPMKVDEKAIQQLIEIVDLFPSYFVGSNAAMPIIGGSILSHAHFQGGKLLAFPLMLVKAQETFNHVNYPSVQVSTLDWPSFVLRLESTDSKSLKSCILNFMEKWSTFEAKEISLDPYYNQEPHHGVAPIIHKEGNTYVVHLIFRSNITNEAYPDGVFHAHPEYHHIKKEGIGLIEAMGMFILPGRLVKVLNKYSELTTLDEFYSLVEQYPIHKNWLLQNLLPIKFEPKHLKERFIEELAKVCHHILEDISVFKKDALGQHYQNKFLEGTR